MTGHSGRVPGVPKHIRLVCCIESIRVHNKRQVSVVADGFLYWDSNPPAWSMGQTPYEHAPPCHFFFHGVYTINFSPFLLITICHYLKHVRVLPLKPSPICQTCETCKQSQLYRPSLSSEVIQDLARLSSLCQKDRYDRVYAIVELCGLPPHPLYFPYIIALRTSRSP